MDEGRRSCDGNDWYDWLMLVGGLVVFVLLLWLIIDNAFLLERVIKNARPQGSGRELRILHQAG